MQTLSAEGTLSGQTSISILSFLRLLGLADFPCYAPRQAMWLPVNSENTAIMGAPRGRRDKPRAADDNCLWPIKKANEGACRFPKSNPKRG